MPLDASLTREKLIDEAARAFAEHGVYGASLIDITRQAGQRNRGALHYHFGSRTGILCAVLERHVEFLSRREGELLEAAMARPDRDLEPVVEAIVRPATELAGSGWRGRCFVVILAELIEEDPESLEPELTAVLDRTGGHAVYAEMRRRIDHLSFDIVNERLALSTGFILHAVADRARVVGRRRKRRLRLDHDEFVRNLVTMISAALVAPSTG